MKAAFKHPFNESLILTDGIRILSNGNSIPFSSLWKSSLALISVFTEWMISLKNTFPIDGEKLSVTGVSKKWRKKMVSNGRKISYPLARIRFFFKSCFSLIPIMVFNSRKIVLIKKTFSLHRKFVSTSRVLDFLKNTFPLNGKGASISTSWLLSEKMKENDFHYPEN